MVIELHALVADRAVEGCLGLDGLTVGAEVVEMLVTVKGLFDHIDEIEFLRDVPWLEHDRKNIHRYGHGEQDERRDPEEAMPLGPDLVVLGVTGVI